MCIRDSAHTDTQKIIKILILAFGTNVQKLIEMIITLKKFHYGKNKCNFLKKKHLDLHSDEHLY